MAKSSDKGRNDIGATQLSTPKPADEQELIPPPAVRADIPDFHKLDPLKFQQLCCELHRSEPLISFADVFGINGQAQYGVDIVAHRSANDGIEAGQCKRIDFAGCKPHVIRGASDEFIKHLEYSALGVRLIGSGSMIYSIFSTCTFRPASAFARPAITALHRQARRNNSSSMLAGLSGPRMRFL
jgi:hypothetical protein